MKFKDVSEVIIGKANALSNYEPPSLEYTDEEIVPYSAFLTARSGMGMCKHTYA